MKLIPTLLAAATLAFGLSAQAQESTIRKTLAERIPQMGKIDEASRAVTNREVPVVIGGRRAGDAAALVSSSTHAIEELGWEPRHSTLRQMIGDAWAWAQKPGFSE
jgi:UDP-glucose 4-epimerase